MPTTDFFMRYACFGCVFCLLCITSHSQPRRYLDRVFDSVVVERDIIYGYADRYDWWNQYDPQPLQMEIHLPHGDSLRDRPLVMMIHGGAFIIGHPRAKKDVELWCDSLAHAGYVAANIQYRLGYNIVSQKSMIRAGYRAVQDVRAAIRFVKEYHTQLGIDTTCIFLGGNSSGSIAAIHAVYMSDTERPEETYGVGKDLESEDLGCLDCSGNAYPHDATVAGIVSLWGGVFHPTLIDRNEAVPMLMIHGTKDKVVPIGEGRAFKLPIFPKIYGSEVIHAHMDSLNIAHVFHPFEKEKHTFYHSRPFLNFPNDKWETVWNLGKEFLYQQVVSPSLSEVSEVGQEGEISKR